MFIKHNRILKPAGRALFALSGRLMPCVAHLMLVIMLRPTPFVAQLACLLYCAAPYDFCSTPLLMLVIVLNMPEHCSFQDMLFHMLFMPKYAELRR